MSLFEVINVENGKPIKAWKKGVLFEEAAVKQLENLARMPFIFSHIAAMPDTHWGMGSTVGSVFACKGAVIPAAVGVDIGCGMHAELTNFTKKDLPDLTKLRHEIERFIPAGRTNDGGRGDRGAWASIPSHVQDAWKTELEPAFTKISEKHPRLGQGNLENHLGTLGTGNHFVEVCLDTEDRVWFMLHSGSRGVGNRIGSYFIALAKQRCKENGAELKDWNLAYLDQGTKDYNDYIEAMLWAQNFALINRRLMMKAVHQAWTGVHGTQPQIELSVNTHHNYAQIETHLDQEVLLTRKGAVRARIGDWCIVPGSMGARSYIAKGLGNQESFMSCSHGAGRAMSRSQAKETISLEQHKAATLGVECDKTRGTIDESPAAYKDIDAVIAAEADLIEPVYILKQVLCVKGVEEENNGWKERKKRKKEARVQVKMGASATDFDGED